MRYEKTELIYIKRPSYGFTVYIDKRVEPSRGDFIKIKDTWAKITYVHNAKDEFQVNLSKKFNTKKDDRVVLYRLRSIEFVDDETSTVKGKDGDYILVPIKDKNKFRAEDFIRTSNEFFMVQNVEDFSQDKAKITVVPDPTNVIVGDKVFINAEWTEGLVTRKIYLKPSPEIIQYDDTKWEDYEHKKAGRRGYYEELWYAKIYPDGRTEYIKKHYDLGHVDEIPDIIIKGTKPIKWTNLRHVYIDKEIIIEYEDNPDKYIGYERVKREGSKGQVKETYKQYYTKDNLDREERISIQTHKVGVSRIIVRGTKAPDYLWRRIKVKYKNGQEEIKGVELLNDDKLIQELKTEFRGYQEITDKKIESKVSETTFDKSQQVLNERFSEINQKADSIELKVENKGRYRNIIPQSDYWTNREGFKYQGVQGYNGGAYGEGNILLGIPAGSVEAWHGIPISATQNKIGDKFTLLFFPRRSLNANNLKDMTILLSDEDWNTISPYYNFQFKENIIEMELNKAATPKYLTIYLKTEISSDKFTGISISPSYLALVEGAVPNLTWDMTYLTNNGASIKVTNDKLAEVELKASETSLKLNSGGITLNGNTTVSSGFTLKAYRGEIGNFILGRFFNQYGNWVTSSDYQTGIGGPTGAGGYTALWANWGSQWDKAGPKSWRVTSEGNMYANNTSTFNGDVNINSTMRVSSQPVFYRGMQVYGGNIDVAGNDVTGDYGNGKTRVIWWSQINSLKSQISDIKAKENIKNSEYKALCFISSLKFKEFDYKKDFENGKHEKLGLIAQDLEKIDKDFVYEEKGMKRIKYLDMIPLLLKANQELLERNNELEKRIEKLEKAMKEGI